MKFHVILASLALVLSACSSGGGGGSGSSGGGTVVNPGGGSATTCTGLSIGTYTPSQGVAKLQAVSTAQIGVALLGADKTMTYCVTNTGTVRTDALSTKVSTASGTNISIVSSTCSGLQLQPGSSCSVVVKLNSAAAGGFQNTIQVYDVSRFANTVAYGYAIDYATMNSLVSEISSDQSSNADTTNNPYFGGWFGDYDDYNTASVQSTAVIIDALMSSSKFLTTSDFQALYTPNVNLSTVDLSTVKPLDRALYFMAYDASSRLPIKFDPTITGSNANTAYVKFGQGYNATTGKPKQISPAVLNVASKLNKLIVGSEIFAKDGTTPIETQYLTSRQLAANSTLAANISSQIGYLFDTTRQPTYKVVTCSTAAPCANGATSGTYAQTPSYNVETDLKDLNLYYSLLAGDSSSLSLISQITASHLYFSIEEVQAPSSSFDSGSGIQDSYPQLSSPYSLTYSSDEFTTNVSKTPASSSGISQFPELASVANWSLSGSTSAFPDSYYCRDYSYALISYINAYKNLGFATTSTTMTNLYANLSQEISNNLPAACHKTNGTYVSGSAATDAGYSATDNAIPLIFKVLNSAPDGIVSVNDKISMFNQLRTAISTSGSVRGNNATSEVKAEALKALIELM